MINNLHKQQLFILQICKSFAILLGHQSHLKYVHWQKHVTLSFSTWAFCVCLRTLKVPLNFSCSSAFLGPNLHKPWLSAAELKLNHIRICCRMMDDWRRFEYHFVSLQCLLYLRDVCVHVSAALTSRRVCALCNWTFHILSCFSHKLHCILLGYYVIDQCMDARNCEVECFTNKNQQMCGARSYSGNWPRVQNAQSRKSSSPACNVISV